MIHHATVIERAELTTRFHEEWMTKPGRIEATVELHSIGGQEPYFSVTGAVYEVGRRRPDICGCCHDEILAVWPQLAPLVALHLSTADGVPIHAEANGLFWMNVTPRRVNRPMFGYKGPDNWMWEYRTPRSQYDPEPEFETDERGIEWSPQRTARTLRIPVDDARALRARLIELSPAEAGAAFHAWIEARRPTWKAEADAGIALIRALNEKET